MTRKELIKCMAEKMDISQFSSALFLKTFQDILLEHIQQNDQILLQGFGVFTPWEQTARPGRNPRNGVDCIIPARLSIKFKPGKELLKQLNAKDKQAD